MGKNRYKAPVSDLRRFGLLLWKNWLLMIRQPFDLLLVICFPLALVALLVLIRSAWNRTIIPDRSYPSLPLEDIP